MNKIAMYVLSAFILAGGALGWYMMRAKPVEATPALTADARAYTRKLQLSGVTMKATESYMQQMVTEIEGTITNSGDRDVKQADLVCVFYNAYGEVILREKVPIVQRALKPGEARQFRLPFDDIPSSWNNQMPQLVIARIEFI